MGGSEDPKDGGAVAAAVFGAVIVYAVRTSLLQKSEQEADTLFVIDIPPFLRITSFSAHPTEPTRGDSVALGRESTSCDLLINDQLPYDLEEVFMLIGFGNGVWRTHVAQRVHYPRIERARMVWRCLYRHFDLI